MNVYSQHRLYHIPLPKRKKDFLQCKSHWGSWSSWKRNLFRNTTSYNLFLRPFIKRQTSGTTSDNEWQRLVQRVTTSSTTSDDEWKRVTTKGVTISANFFFRIREEPTTKHPKENFLNLKEDIWRGIIELRAETSPYEEILTVRSRNGRSSCSHILFKTSVLKNSGIFTGKYQCWSLYLIELQVLKPASLLNGNLC